MVDKISFEEYSWFLRAFNRISIFLRPKFLKNSTHTLKSLMIFLLLGLYYFQAFYNHSSMMLADRKSLTWINGSLKYSLIPVSISSIHDLNLSLVSSSNESKFTPNVSFEPQTINPINTGCNNTRITSAMISVTVTCISSLSLNHLFSKACALNRLINLFNLVSISVKNPTSILNYRVKSERPIISSRLKFGYFFSKPGWKNAWCFRHFSFWVSVNIPRPKNLINLIRTFFPTFILQITKSTLCWMDKPLFCRSYRI